MPWADDAGASFVEWQDEYARLLGEAGFAVERTESLVPVIAAAGPPPEGSLNPGDLFGPGFAERIGNNLTAAFAGILSPILMVARAV